MVASADNLNHDVLEYICNFCLDPDLFSLALVSQSFMAAAYPQLYRTICFQERQAKNYPKLLSPFTVLLKHQKIADHVRALDLRAIPLIHGNLNPQFMRELVSALKLCKNLSSFRCILSGNDALIPILPCLENKERLQSLRIHSGSLSTQQATFVTKVTQLQNLALDSPSWQMLNALDEWSSDLGSTLTSLTIFNSSEANSDSLRPVLAHLPLLQGFHLVGCSKVDYPQALDLAKDIASLESLSITAYRKEEASQRLPFTFPKLRELSVEIRMPPGSQGGQATVTDVFRRFDKFIAPGLVAIKIKSLDGTTPIGTSFVKSLLEVHATTLETLAVIVGQLKVDSTRLICKRCTKLRRLELPFDMQDLTLLGTAASHSKSLSVMVNTADAHTKRGSQASLTRSQAQRIMDVATTVHTIISEPRIFTRQRLPGEVKLTTRTGRRPAEHWFIHRS